MIKVSVMYAHNPNAKFDMNYYVTKHMPMVKQKVGAALKSIEVEQGLSGGAPGSAPAYVATGHMYFESVEAFQAAFLPHRKEISADVPNYTDIVPTMQISEVKL